MWILLVYYRIYAEDGAIPSKIPVTPSNPFIGRIKAKSLPPPRIAETVKCGIATFENIKDGESASLFLTPYSESPMGDADKVIILGGTGPGSTPQEPLALVAKMSDSERSVLESDGRGGLASAAEPDTAPPEIPYRMSSIQSLTFLFVTPRLLEKVYYLLYANSYEIPPKVAFDVEEPFLGRIPVDSVAPPYSLTSIKRCISRVEGNPEFAFANVFANTSSDTPLREGHISLLRTDGPGQSPDEPMAIVQVKTPSIPDGKYVIKNRAADICWNAGNNPITTVYFSGTTIENAKVQNYLQVINHSPIIPVFRG